MSRQLQHALRSLEAHASRSDSLRDICGSLNSALIEIKESSRELSHFLDSQELDPARLADLEHKIGEAQRLARKHKVLAAELPHLQAQLKQELAQYQHSQDTEALQKAVELSEYEEVTPLRLIADEVTREKLTSCPTIPIPMVLNFTRLLDARLVIRSLLRVMM